MPILALYCLLTTTRNYKRTMTGIHLDIMDDLLTNPLKRQFSIFLSTLGIFRNGHAIFWHIQNQTHTPPVGRMVAIEKFIRPRNSLERHAANVKYVQHRSLTELRVDGKHRCVLGGQAGGHC